MSNNRLTFEGLDELRAGLRQLPDDLAQEAGVVIADEAEGAKNEIIDTYRRNFKGDDLSGNLERGVRVRRLDGGRFGAAALVQSTAPHAHLYEYGTETRHTRAGVHRGKMPPAGPNGMVPIVRRRRRRMYERLKGILVKQGLEVRGEP